MNLNKKGLLVVRSAGSAFSGEEFLGFVVGKALLHGESSASWKTSSGAWRGM